MDAEAKPPWMGSRRVLSALCRTPGSSAYGHQTEQKKGLPEPPQKDLVIGSPPGLLEMISHTIAPHATSLTAFFHQL
jgi:hypothetical protein